MAKDKTTTNVLQRFVFIYVGFAFAVKILLQLISCDSMVLNLRSVLKRGIAYLYLDFIDVYVTFLLSQVI